jgi:hypothetical protein
MFILGLLVGVAAVLAIVYRVEVAEYVTDAVAYLRSLKK